MTKAKKAPPLSLFGEIDPQKTSNEPEVKTIKGFSSVGDLFSKYQVSEQNKHIAHEFQSFGCHLAEVLADKKHTSLYIKLAKTINRGLLERALSFVIDSTADNKAKLFMWKLEQLKKQDKTHEILDN